MEKDITAEVMEKYPEKFTGRTIVVHEPTPEQQAISRALMRELETLAAPLVEWLRENYSPHTDIVISWDHVWVKHDGMGIPYHGSKE